MLIYGKNSIKERLKINPRSILRLYIQDNFQDDSIMELARENNIYTQRKNEREMSRTKRADRLQGIIAEIEPFKYSSIESVLSAPEKQRPNIIFLDGLNDPQNIGSILRIAACFGNIALCLPEFGSCDINETVLHVASGAENFTPIIRVSNLACGLKRAKDAGYFIAGTAVSGGTNLARSILKFPLGLILGSEGKGMNSQLQKYIDLNLTIPMAGAPLSFNVAMASAIFCYEIARQNKQ